MSMQYAILAGGCFWCTEAIFKRLKGVSKVTSGFTGGMTENPTYEQVVSGRTGHAESIQIEYNPSEISFEQLLTVFFHLHDPTTLNQQGADIGTHYRSAIFYSDTKQLETAKQVIKQIEEEKVYKDPIVTTLEPFKKFYIADEYQRDFYAKNGSFPYCKIVIDPKIQKLLDEFKLLLKSE